jgi:hypothetical protein
MPRRGKEIAFLLLAVIALAVAVTTFRGKSAPAKKPAKKPPTAAQKARPSGKAGEKVQGQGAPGAPAGPATRNPFVAPGGTPEAALASPPTPTGSEAAKAESGPAATGPGGAVTVVQGPAAGGPKPGPAGPEGLKEAKLTLTGIIAGQPSMAVIREDDQRHFVRVGDRVGDRYRVSAIGRQEVVLVGGEGKLILRLRGGG